MFSLYENQGTDYNYKKGGSSTISFEYDDSEGTITIGDCKGCFEGMLTNRTFRINAIDKSATKPTTVQYNGTKTVVKL